MLFCHPVKSTSTSTGSFFSHLSTIHLCSSRVFTSLPSDLYLTLPSNWLFLSASDFTQRIGSRRKHLDGSLVPVFLAFRHQILFFPSDCVVPACREKAQEAQLFCDSDCCFRSRSSLPASLSVAVLTQAPATSATQYITNQLISTTHYTHIDRKKKLHLSCLNISCCLHTDLSLPGCCQQLAPAGWRPPITALTVCHDSCRSLIQ